MLCIAPEWQVITACGGVSGACQAGPEPLAMARFRDLQKMYPECMRHRRALRPEMSAKNAPVAQLDRAPDYESGGQEFESLRARHSINDLERIHPPDVVSGNRAGNKRSGAS